MKDNKFVVRHEPMYIPNGINCVEDIERYFNVFEKAIVCNNDGITKLYKRYKDMAKDIRKASWTIIALGVAGWFMNKQIKQLNKEVQELKDILKEKGEDKDVRLSDDFNQDH